MLDNSVTVTFGSGVKGFISVDVNSVKRVTVRVIHVSNGRSILALSICHAALSFRCIHEIGGSSGVLINAQARCHLVHWYLSRASRHDHGAGAVRCCTHVHA